MEVEAGNLVMLAQRGFYHLRIIELDPTNLTNLQEASSLDDLYN